MSDLFSQVGEMIKKFTDTSTPSTDLRSKYLLPERGAQSQKEPAGNRVDNITDVMYPPKSWSGPIDTKSDDNFGLWDKDDPSDQPHDPNEAERNRLVNMGIEYEKNGLSVKRSEEDARDLHYQYLKKVENSNNLGLKKVGQEERFFPIKSGEGKGPDKSMSEFEIGHGIKIPSKWLSNNKADWPLINGVRVDIRQGITKEQDEAMVRTLLGRAYKVAGSKLKFWDKMKPSEKSFWADLIYNGGKKAIDKNPKALRAANRGDTVEAMVLALDYIKSGGEVSRGLLNRRLSMYNKAAMEIPGCPVIEAYRFGDGIKVKFSHGFSSKDEGFDFSVEHDEGGWYDLLDRKVSNNTVEKKMGDDLRFYS